MLNTNIIALLDLFRNWKYIGVLFVPNTDKGGSPRDITFPTRVTKKRFLK